MATPEKRAAMQKKFKQLDKDGNGVLDFNELHDLLLKGHPGFKEEDAWDLFRKCDKDGSGSVSFDEFLDYIYGEGQAAHKAGRSTEGRHAALAAKSGPQQDGTEEDWGKCFGVFEAYAGKDMDGKEFAKFCKDNHLIGHGMKKTDVDLIFAKVVPKGKRRMDFEMFKESCRHVAGKRGCSNRDVQVIIEGSGGPVLSGTKTEYSKFYDDKSTYTGAATANEKLGADHSHAFGRHEQQQAAAAAKGEAADDEDASLWPQIQQIFDQFVAQDCGGDGLDGRTFLKLCNDSGNVGKSFTKQDVDIVFSTVARKAKKIDFSMFQHAVRNIAAKKKASTADVQQRIVEAGGPQMHGVTKLEAVKFYDDKDQYTGAAADVFDRGGHGEDRHARLAADSANKGGSTEDEHPWDACIATFNSYGGENGVDSREFNKMCNDMGLYDKKFTKNDVDIVFTKAKGSNAVRSLNAETFCTAVRLIADKKGVPTHQVQNVIANSEGPIIKGTEGASRFHDDKDSYTGMHVGK